jgi:Uma2 family endonuclease
MAMTVDTRLFTADDLLRIPEDGSRYELVEGELKKRMSPAGYDHGDIAMNIGAHLKAYVRAHRLGKVFAAETGFLLSRNPDTVLAPDVSYVRTERLMRPRGRGYFIGYPDLAVEVISPDDLYTDVDEKTQHYLKAGTPAVVIVNPRTGTVHVHRGTNDMRAMTDTLEVDEVVPGWKMPLAEVFEE